MLIDWFTVVAQLINFLLLIWLMKRFLYKPILNAVNTREQNIKEQITRADLKEKEAVILQEALTQKLDAAEAEIELSKKIAIEETEAYKHALKDQAKKEYELLKIKQNEVMEEDEVFFQEEMMKRAQNEVFRIARKTLADLSSTSLEDQIIVVFCNRLKNLETHEKQKLREVFESSEHALTIRSAFDLTKSQRESIEGVLKNLIPLDAEITFGKREDLLGGIEIVTNGYKLSWNLDEYLNELLTKTRELARRKKVIKHGG